MGQLEGESNRGAGAAAHRVLRQTAAVVATVSVLLSVARLGLHCMRALVPAACASCLVIQLLDSRARPPRRADKGRFLALAGAWGTAAFCDCTAATDYWLAPTVLSDPVQLVCLPLACSSFMISAAAAFLSSRFAAAGASPPLPERPHASPEEEKLLAAPAVCQPLECRSPAAADDSALTAVTIQGACCPYAAGAREQPHCPCLSCSSCCQELNGPSGKGLPTVPPLTRCHAGDPAGRQRACGFADLDALEVEASRARLQAYPADCKAAADGSFSANERLQSKSSAFTPSYPKEGGLLAGFAAFEGGKAGFRAPAAWGHQAEGWPRVRVREYCGWTVSSVTGELTARQPSKLGVKPQESLKWHESQGASAEAADSEGSQTYRECWSPCSGGSLPLLEEFLEDDGAAGNHPQGEAARACMDGRSNEWSATHGLEAGWKPYLSMLGFQGSGGSKRFSGRTRRIGDLQWLDVMVVDVEEEGAVGFSRAGASRVCIV